MGGDGTFPDETGSQIPAAMAGEEEVIPEQVAIRWQ